MPLGPLKDFIICGEESLAQGLVVDHVPLNHGQLSVISQVS
jgi:hypothetical protein